VRLAAFIIPARRLRRRFAATTPAAVNRELSVESSKAGGLRQGHVGNQCYDEGRNSDCRGDEKLTHLALRPAHRALGALAFGNLDRALDRRPAAGNAAESFVDGGPAILNLVSDDIDVAR
jgi:hypothetical protein